MKGQELDARRLRRLREARALIAAAGHGAAAGGGRRQPARTPCRLLRQAGAETVVLGSLAFGDPDLPARIAWLHALEADA